MISETAVKALFAFHGGMKLTEYLSKSQVEVLTDLINAGCIQIVQDHLTLTAAGRDQLITYCDHMEIKLEGLNC
jgi:hypothetical protein